MLANFFESFNIVAFLFKVVGILMPFPLAYVAVNLWHHYRNERFIEGIQWVLLEIQLPREMNKTPAAMELVFSNAFYHKSSKGFWELYIQGAVWFWFSLEMISVDGKVHFFIRTPSRIRDLVETQIYGQFPQAKVTEVEDYVYHVPQYKKNGSFNMWGCEFTKKKHDAYPIKTYKDWGDEMKTGQKEEFKIDPLTPTIEYLGSLRKGEQVWIQIIVRQSLKTWHSHRTGRHEKIYEAAIDELFRITAPYTRHQKNEDSPPDNLTFAKDIRTPEPIKPFIKAVTDHMSQVHYDCGIRVVAIADKKYITDERFNNLRREVRLLFRQFSSPSINELHRINSTQFDAPWSDPTGLALTKMKKKMLDWYRLRIFYNVPIQYNFKYPNLIKNFFPPGRPEIFVVSSEELATLFHFPGMVSETPTFKRIESRIAKPPSNLPS